MWCSLACCEIQSSIMLVSLSLRVVTSSGSSSRVPCRSRWCAPFGIVKATRVSDMFCSTPPPCQGSSSPLLCVQKFLVSEHCVSIHSCTQNRCLYVPKDYVAVVGDVLATIESLDKVWLDGDLIGRLAVFPISSEVPWFWSEHVCHSIRTLGHDHLCASLAGKIVNCLVKFWIVGTHLITPALVSKALCSILC